MLRQYISNMIVCILWDSSWTHINRHNINVPFCFLLHFISILLVIPFVTCLLLDFSLYSTFVRGARVVEKLLIHVANATLSGCLLLFHFMGNFFFRREREKRKIPKRDGTLNIGYQVLQMFRICSDACDREIFSFLAFDCTPFFFSSNW